MISKPTQCSEGRVEREPHFVGFLRDFHPPLCKHAGDGSPRCCRQGGLRLVMADTGPENENGFPDTILSASYVPALCLSLSSENRVGTCLFCGEDQIPVQH